MNHLTRASCLLTIPRLQRARVVTRTMIWKHLYDEYDENHRNVVDVYIPLLRTKIERLRQAVLRPRWGEGHMHRGEETEPREIHPATR